MKKILLLALVIPSLAFSQKRTSEPFNGATKVYITDTLSTSANFHFIGNKLNELTFYIDKKDDDFKFISSKPIDVKVYGSHGGGYSRYFQIIYIVVKDHEIVMTTKSMSNHAIKLLGQYQGDAGAENVEWDKKGKGAVFFDNMLKLTDGIPNVKIEYGE